MIDLQIAEMDGGIHLNPSHMVVSKNVSCLMKGLMLRESVQYSMENNPALYACFLDAKLAFDHAWISSLFKVVLINLCFKYLNCSSKTVTAM
jgi:hypothetical protein